MGKVIVKFKSIDNNKSVVTYMDGKMALIKDYKELSDTYDYIGDFKYDKELQTSVALVKKYIGTKIKDTLMGYINLDGQLLPYVYSIYMDKYYKLINNDFNDLVNGLNKELEYASIIKENKEIEAKIKVLSLGKLNIITNQNI